MKKEKFVQEMLKSPFFKKNYTHHHGNTPSQRAATLPELKKIAWEHPREGVGVVPPEIILEKNLKKIGK